MEWGPLLAEELIPAGRVLPAEAGHSACWSWLS